MIFSNAIQQASQSDPFPVGVVIAVIGAIVSLVTLGVQWRKDVQEQQRGNVTASSASADKLFDQYQEELDKCREDRVAFRTERHDWEKEREELVAKVRKIEEERTNLSYQLTLLQFENKKLKDDIADLRKRLNAALEE